MTSAVKEERTAAQRPQHVWTFLSNHCHVLVVLSREPFARLRDIAAAVGITERAVQRIVRDLEEAQVLEKSKDGRRNRYRVNRNVPLRHPLESNRTIGELLDLLND